MLKAIFLLLLTSCTRHLPYDFKSLIIPVDVKPIILDFERDSVTYGHPILIDNLEVKFVKNFSSLHLGQCNPFTLPPLIEINDSYREYHELVKRVMYHELGHCVLGRQHDDRMFNGYPISVMNSILVEGPIWHSHENYYLNELFNWR